MANIIAQTPPADSANFTNEMSDHSMSEHSQENHLTTEELVAGLDHVRASPADEGVLEMIVGRPSTNQRAVLHEGQLDLVEGLAGDNWLAASGRYTRDGRPDADTQITIMNARAAALVARTKDRWPLAGDQLYVDFDLSEQNAPAETRLQIGQAVLEITPPPHLGCKKFLQRFGAAALKFVNSEVGKQLHLRGVNAKVVQAGAIRVGDRVRKL